MKRSTLAACAALCVGFLAAGAILHTPVVTHNDTQVAMVATLKK